MRMYFNILFDISAEVTSPLAGVDQELPPVSLEGIGSSMAAPEFPAVSPKSKLLLASRGSSL